MKRRTVLKVGAVAAGAGIGVPGCSLPKLVGSLHGDDGAATFNAMLDDQLGRLSKPGLLHRLVEERTQRPMSEDQRAALAEHDAMFRRMLGTLLVSQGFRDLPQETQVHDAVQARMRGHLPEMGTTIYATSDLLASLDASQRASVRKALRDDPGLPMSLGEALDERSARTGISTKRRLQLRSTIVQSAFRLKHGDPGTVIDEYVGKVERLRASDTNDALVLDVSTKLGEKEFWRTQRLRAADDTTPPPASAVPPAAPVEPMLQPPGLAPIRSASNEKAARDLYAHALTLGTMNCPEVAKIARDIWTLDREVYNQFAKDDRLTGNCEWLVPGETDKTHGAGGNDHPGSHGLRVGGYMLVIGLVTDLVSGVILGVASNDVAAIGVVGLTLGSVLIMIALLVLLISALIYAAG
jgi:hypothetical protein